MESVADDIGPEAAVRPPARKPGSARSPRSDRWSTRTGRRPSGRRPPLRRRRLTGAGRAAVPVPQVEVGRRYRQTIHRVDLWSVLKIAVCFYICGMAVTMVALVALWLIADAAGVIHSVEKFFGDLLQTKDFTFLDAEILRGALLVAAVLVVLQIVITVIAAAFYNVFAELFGGVEITISEDETAL